MKEKDYVEFELSEYKIKHSNKTKVQYMSIKKYLMKKFPGRKPAFYRIRAVAIMRKKYGL